MSDPDQADMSDLFDELDELDGLVDAPEEREQVRETLRVAMEASANAGPFGRIVRGFDRGDLAEALLGSVLFGIPMAVEGGTHEVGVFLAAHPPLLAGTLGFAVALVAGILYVADFQDVRITHRLLGLVPRRPVGVIGVAFLTATVMLTAWGRVDWATPWIAFGNVAVAFLPMSVGAALGDILPGS
jgi:uncharacterized membrane protein